MLKKREVVSNLNREPFIYASYQVWLHLAKWCQRRFFRNRPIGDNNCLWRPCFSTNRDKMNNLYRGCFLPSFSSIGRSVSEEKIFQNRPIRNKNCLWGSCLLMDWDEMYNLYKGPSIDASYQDSFHLA